MPKVRTIDYDGNTIYVDVDSETADYLTENDTYFGALINADQNHLQQMSLDYQNADRNSMLLTKYTAEDEYYYTPQKNEIGERAFYRKRLMQCREHLPMIKEACTAKQWRRFCLYHANGLSHRKIAVLEKVHRNAVHMSIKQAQRKIITILLQIQDNA